MGNCSIAILNLEGSLERETERERERERENMVMERGFPLGHRGLTYILRPIGPSGKLSVFLLWTKLGQFTGMLPFWLKPTSDH